MRDFIYFLAATVISVILLEEMPYLGVLTLMPIIVVLGVKLSRQ